MCGKTIARTVLGVTKDSIMSAVVIMCQALCHCVEVAVRQGNGNILQVMEFKADMRANLL